MYLVQNSCIKNTASHSHNLKNNKLTTQHAWPPFLVVGQGAHNAKNFPVHYCMTCMFLVLFIQHLKFVIELHNLAKTTCHIVKHCFAKLLAIVYVTNVDPMTHIIWSSYSTIVDASMYSANGSFFIVGVCEVFQSCLLRYHWKFPWCDYIEN
jgi:hypothetical protein